MENLNVTKITIIDPKTGVETIIDVYKRQGLTVKQVRTALEHLKRTGEVTHKATSKYGLFTVCLLYTSPLPPAESEQRKFYFQ